MEGKKMSVIGWITLTGAILMLLSLFVAEASERMRNKALFDLANVLTLTGFIGLLIGLLNWMFGS